MSINIHSKMDKEDKPFTRADVERLLQEAGSSKKLDLSGMNLRDIDLTHFNLTGSNLKSANLNRADLRNATLKDCNLSESYLRGVDLTGADLSGADLSNTDLQEANLRELDLSTTNLRGADLDSTHLDSANLKGLDLHGIKMRWAFLSKANLSKVNANKPDFFTTDLSGADLSDANLSGASLNHANLSEANLSGVKLNQADLTATSISSKSEEDILHGLGINWSSEIIAMEDLRSGVFHIRITEDPLTTYNLATIISALTELSTKCWLIAKGNFADLIEYTQTHNARFTEEANLIITKVRHNSPLSMSMNFPNFDPKNIVDALVTALDGVTQAKLRFKRTEIEIQARAQEIQLAEQQDTHGNEMALLEQEKKRLEVESQRLVLMEQRLELQKKEVEYALEIASMMVDKLHPNADQATRAMEMQAILPNILQLQNGKGLELALPAPK